MQVKLTLGAITILMLSDLVLGQDKDSSLLQRQSLQDYSLAKCSDGTPAAYYADRVSILLSQFQTIMSCFLSMRF